MNYNGTRQVGGGRRPSVACWGSALLGLLVALAGGCDWIDGIEPGGGGGGGAVGNEAWGPGDYPPELRAERYLEIEGVDGQDGLVRQYKVHVPPSYDPSVPTPLVFCMHGLAQTPVLFCVNGAEWPEKSDEEGFILVMPLGYESSWNAGVCCGGASEAKLDDVALVRAILAEVQTHLNVDGRRVYATGLSNGGFMSYRLACEATDLFAAIAPNSALIGLNGIGTGTNPEDSDFFACEPSRPIPVFDSHGTADPIVDYSFKAASLERMRTLNGCSATTRPAVAPVSAGDTTCVSYEGCPPGGEITACAVEGGGHCWFGGDDCGTGAGFLGQIFVGNNSDTLRTTDEAWRFLERHSLPR